MWGGARSQRRLPTWTLSESGSFPVAQSVLPGQDGFEAGRLGDEGGSKCTEIWSRESPP